LSSAARQRTDEAATRPAQTTAQTTAAALLDPEGILDATVAAALRK
jgi:hypothetical protein